MTSIPRLKKRADFIRVAKTPNMVSTSSFIIQQLSHECLTLRDVEHEPFRVGFTASRRVGNAVLRNRAKRRLRVLVQRFAPYLSITHSDFVLIAKPAIIISPFSVVIRDFKYALNRLGIGSSL